MEDLKDWAAEAGLVRECRGLLALRTDLCPRLIASLASPGC